MKTERICLRALRRSDSDQLYEWINSRELVLLSSAFHPVSELEHEAWMEAMIAQRSDLVIFVIEDRATVTAIGTCQLHNINWRHRHAELQIRIGDAASRGKGLGTEAVRLMCQFGFADLNLHRIFLHVFANNIRAITAYEKAGFTREGLLKDAAYIDGKYQDVVSMGKVRSDE